MSEDVIEFGDTPSRRPRRVQSRPSPFETAKLVALVGVIAGIGSLLLPWQSTRADFGGGGPDDDLRVIQAGLLDFGAIGTFYSISLIGLIAAATVVLFGQSSVRPTARLISYAFGGTTLVGAGVLAFWLSNNSILLRPGFLTLPEELQLDMQLSLMWGAYAAIAAGAFLVAAALLQRDPIEAEPQAADYPAAAEPIIDPEMELTVSVDDTTPGGQAATGNPLYMKPR